MTPDVDDEDDDLPEGWTREFQGRHGAEFFHEDKTVAVRVLPRYDPPGGRASQSVPARYLVRLQRPYSDRLGIPIEIATVEAFEDALDTARAFMRGFSASASDGSGRRAAVETLASVGGYADDRLVELLVDRTGDGLLAVAHATPDGVEPVYGLDSPTAPVGNVPVDRLCDRLRAAGNGLGRAVDAPVEGTATVTADATLLWIPTGDRSGTLVAVDPDASVAVPVLIEECATLLSLRDADRD